MLTARCSWPDDDARRGREEQPDDDFGNWLAQRAERLDQSASLISGSQARAAAPVVIRVTPEPSSEG
jgi:hypothetical protein